MIKGLLILFFIMAAIFAVLAFTLKRKIKTGFEDWIKQNNLKYKREVPTGDFNTDLLNDAFISFEHIIWGLYKNKRIYIYTVLDSTGIETRKRMFFNGNFYSKIKAEDIDNLLENESYLKKIDGFDTDNPKYIEIQVPQLIAANTFLATGKEVEYRTVNKIYKLFEKFAYSKANFKDKLISHLMERSCDMNFKCNDPEVVDFIVNHYNEVDRETIKQVADEFENLLIKTRAQNLKNSESLENIDMSKFR